MNILPLILDLKGMNLEMALRRADQFGPRVQAVKIHSLWDRVGPSVVGQLLNAGARNVMLDLKLHDTPDAVAERAAAAADAGASIITVHASGGLAMLRRAQDSGALLVAGVTVLTSLDSHECEGIYGQRKRLKVLNLAKLCEEAGMECLVFPPSLIHLSRLKPFAGMKFIVPGTRSAGVPSNDHVHPTTPVYALQHGATWLVIGREIFESDDPEAAFKRIEGDITPLFLDG